MKTIRKLTDRQLSILWDRVDSKRFMHEINPVRAEGLVMKIARERGRRLKQSVYANPKNTRYFP